MLDLCNLCATLITFLFVLPCFGSKILDGVEAEYMSQGLKFCRCSLLNTTADSLQVLTLQLV